MQTAFWVPNGISRVLVVPVDEHLLAEQGVLDGYVCLTGFSTSQTATDEIGS